MNFDIDHIDPKWKEGRDYQLVCGLDTPLNFRERDEKTNQSKSNRFLPWRVSKGELGEAPVNPGDLCQFLDPDTDEWVLEEFMGEWWYEKTWGSCGPNLGFKVALINNPELHRETFAKILERNPDHQREAFAKLLEKNPNHQSEAGSVGGKRTHQEKDEDGKSIRAKEMGRRGDREKKRKNSIENYKKGVGMAGMTFDQMSDRSKRTMSQRYVDPDHPELGAHSAATLALLQKNRGYPSLKENRVRVK
jgi:hypothetical protein